MEAACQMSSTGEWKGHTEPKVGAVVLNFNSYEDTKTCLSSLLNIAYKLHPIVCIDNASTDGSLAMLERDFQNVKFIKSDRNLGFAGGMNLGIRSVLDAGCDFVFCFNNDAVVDDPHLMSKLLKPFLEDPKVGVTGPEEYDMTGKELRFAGPTGKSKYEMKVQGAAFLISAKVLRELGPYDEAFFLGYEDQDLFLRIEKKGYKLLTVKGARFRHAFRTSTRKQGMLMTYLEARNRIIFFGRHWGTSDFLRGIVKLHLKRMPRYVLMFSDEKRLGMLRAYLSGILDGLVLLPRARQVGLIPPPDPTRWLDSGGKAGRAPDY